jgi:DNA-binding transcriptional LysR family regulator
MNPHRISDATFGALGVDRMISLVAVIENGGFSAAASVLGKSQSRISVHVAEIERVLGVTLIDRSARPVRATESGRVLAEHIRRAFGELSAGVEHVSALQTLDEGEIRIGSFSSATISFLAEVLRGFRQRYPSVQISVIEASGVELERAIASREVALAVCASSKPIQVPGIRYRTLWREHMMLVVPAGELSPNNDSGAIREYLDGRTAITIGGASARSQLGERTESDAANLLPTLGLSSDQVVHTLHPQALVEMVRAGLGVGVASSLDIVAVDRAGVDVHRVEDASVKREVILCWRKGGHFSEAERLLWETLVSAPIPLGTLQVP